MEDLISEVKNVDKCLYERRLTEYQKQYGGYWRFNELKDFCYLENPKFPSQNILEEIGHFSKELITKYPSGIEVQNLNASKLFDIDKEKIVVGNGAAELIKELGELLTGKVLMQIPVFNEYVRCFKNCEIIKNDTSENDYFYSKEDIIKNIKKADAIVIVNPDNPSGNWINFKDIIQILEETKKESTKVIIDESFIDFVDSEEKYTLIDDEILDRYSNLIVIKSISKSYGVPGIRLGVLATSNKEIIQKIKVNLGVWNINSIAEYFLQLINLYKKEYKEACEYIEKQRSIMYNELKKNKFIKVYKSQANYFMCKLLNNDSTEIAMDLLNEYNIFIKDLKGKEGIKGNYIRVAIKEKDDNISLVKALEEVCKKRN